MLSWKPLAVVGRGPRLRSPIGTALITGGCSSYGPALP